MICPDVQVAAPPLTSVPPVRFLLAPAEGEAAVGRQHQARPGVTNRPARPIKGAGHSRQTVPEDRATAQCQNTVGVFPAAPFSVSVWLLMASVWVPLVPPSVNVPFVDAMLRVTV